MDAARAVGPSPCALEEMGTRWHEVELDCHSPIGRLERDGTEQGISARLVIEKGRRTDTFDDVASEDWRAVLERAQDIERGLHLAPPRHCGWRGAKASRQGLASGDARVGR